ncbi:MAG: transcriptional repressor [Oscillospiraceae bacterium]|nr:transcriptional repressor [Oscillospiraceae bacterium]
MKDKRNTLQKRIVSDVFSSMHNHPSAGMVYDAVQEKFPGISRATVYRILAEAAEEGTVQRLKLTDANDRFDITTKKHYHVVCRDCGAVADVETEIDGIGLTERTVGCEGFTVEGCHVEFVGVCEKYQNKTEKII